MEILGGGSELLRSPEELWSGGDMRLSHNTIFLPSANTFDTYDVDVSCLLKDFPDPRLFSQHQVRRRGSISFRSQFAQLGLYADSSWVINQASQAFAKAQFLGEESFQFTVPIANLAGAPIVANKETGLARFYMEPEAFVEGEELVQLLRDKKDLLMDGVDGIDYKIYRERNHLGQPVEKAIMLRIKDEGRKYIPNGVEPILLAGQEHYRAEVDRFLRPVNERGNLDESFLWIGETTRLQLSNNLTAIIDRDTYATSLGRTPNRTPGLHIESRLIDKGSAWPIRLEVVSPIVGPERANWAIFRIAHQASKSA